MNALHNEKKKELLISAALIRTNTILMWMIQYYLFSCIQSEKQKAKKIQMKDSRIEKNLFPRV